MHLAKQLASWVGAAVLAATVCVSGLQARDVGALGGDGGAPFRLTCQTGTVLVGIYMFSGSALDAVMPACAWLNPDKTDWVQPSRGLQWVGGSGGDFQHVFCNPGFVVRHLHVFMDGHRMVNHIRITCADLDSPAWHDSFPEEIGGVAVGDVRFDCGDHEWASGIYGRAGDLIDQIGLQCEMIWPHCAGYADSAAAEAREGIRDCNFNGPRWSPVRSHHLDFCVGLRGDRGPLDAETEARRQALEACRDDGGDDDDDGSPIEPPTPTGLCVVTLDVDVYTAGHGQGQPLGILHEDTPDVRLVEPCSSFWCHVKGPG
ncbi:MAG: hypothetical protein QG656_298, partial [Candidatus Hydrogenedentes bacterium]|nr:hypothetical protein [Candidatus Hydrogenedentota bacterium]